MDSAKEENHEEDAKLGQAAAAEATGQKLANSLIKSQRVLTPDAVTGFADDSFFKEAARGKQTMVGASLDLDRIGGARLFSMTMVGGR